MISNYDGHYTFDRNSIVQHAPDSAGVYYCGKLTLDGKLTPLYIGKSCESVQDRLLDHETEENWPDVTHFGYVSCSFCKEAEDQEAVEIEQYQPKYNDQGK